MHTVGTDCDFALTLVTQADEALNDAYLFIALPELSGLVQAKRSNESVYRAVMGPFDANCFLGYIPADTETSIDVRIAFPGTTADGYRIITLMVGHDDYAQQANPNFSHDWPEIWHEEWPELFQAAW
jgi:hypothetical protein